MNEAMVSQKIIKELKKNGAFAVKMSVEGRNGIPDIYVTSKKVGSFWIETKKCEKIPVRGETNVLGHGFTPIQKKVATDIKKNGTYVCGVIGYKKTQKEWGFKRVETEHFKEKLTKDEFFLLDEFDFSNPVP